MECSVVVEPTSNSKHYGGGAAQFDRVQNSNDCCTLMPMLATSMLCTWGKTSNAIIQVSGGAAQWIKAQVGNRKVVDSRFDF